MKVIYTWLGKSDLDAPIKEERLGPVADFVLRGEMTSEVIVLMYDIRPGAANKLGLDYQSWLNDHLKEHGRDRMTTVLRNLSIQDPTNFNQVYDAMRWHIEDFESKENPMIEERHYLVGPGTSTMAACTIIISRLKSCAGQLWQSDVKSGKGFRKLELPFDFYLRDEADPQSRKIEDWNKRQDEQNLLSGRVVRSSSTRSAFEMAERAAKSEIPVLILGKTGTGKEVLASYIHEASGLKGEFLPMNCGAIAENLIESQLFGFKKGAFTGAQVDTLGIFEAGANGTVFLDELGELPLSAQVKFLRVLQEKKVTRVGEQKERPIHCRILAATHRDLLQQVQNGRFREDLYYRLAGILIRLEDIKDRHEDLAVMIEQFWAEIVQKNPGFPGRELAEKARQALMVYSWPGNVRELRMTLLRVAFLAEGPIVDENTIQRALSDSLIPSNRPLPSLLEPDSHLALGAGQYKEKIDRYRHQLAQQAMQQTQGNKAQAAQLLGITTVHLGRLLKKGTDQFALDD